MEQVERHWLNAVRSRLHATGTDKPSDGLISFSVMWAIALIFSAVSHYKALGFGQGVLVAILEYGVIAAAVALILNPRKVALLMLLAAFMAAQYAVRLPVASNNQTIAFFMNAAILIVGGVALIGSGGAAHVRDEMYERLRIVARYLLAIMYFYGIFHKINVDFLDPDASCAVALYKPLVSLFGMEDNLLGRYGSIASTFIVETITIISLFWRRFFAVGLIIGLVFHYIIPISAYSWYMDFSSLVFALYTLSVPREVSMAFHARTRQLLSFIPLKSAGAASLGVLALLFLIAWIGATAGRAYFGTADITPMMAWHSSWIVIWSIVGGIAMIVLTWAALEALPYRPTPLPRQPWWVYAFPAVLFLSCLSPYLGLKTESSIAMFSNLHTEGGTSNHLVIRQPLYIADYQRDVATIEAASSGRMLEMAQRNLGVVRFELERWLRTHPKDWVSFTMNGQQYQRATAATFPLTEPNLLEKRLLIFKPVDVSRPKVCTH